MKDRNETKKTEKGWEPRTYTPAEDALKTEERSLDIGEHGEFAPGGYYNQQTVNKPERRSLDDVVPPARR